MCYCYIIVKKEGDILLSGILSRDECAQCHYCCAFDSYDIWETPVITPELKTKITTELLPEQKFLKSGNCYVLKLNKESDEDLYYCTLLDKNKGCMLGNDKPFDCRIWPFRIMSLDGHRVITLSPACQTVFSRSISALTQHARKISNQIFSFADKYPEVVKKYDENYPILLVENKTL